LRIERRLFPLDAFLPMPRFQFSLAWLMIAISVACVILFLAATFIDFFGVLFVSTILWVIPTPLLIIAIFGRGDLQAFAIGALVPWIAHIALRYPATGTSFVVVSIWLLPNCIICGALAAATRRWIQSNRRDP
jgi:hypothetical protein